jgi:hypothetical protein
MHAQETVTVKVYAPCDCQPCKDGQRWFYCRGSIQDGPTVEYDCPLFDGMRGVPHPGSVAYIQKENPGAMLLYIHGGAEFARALAEYRRELGL